MPGTALVTPRGHKDHCKISNFAHISKYLFSQNGAVVWMIRVVPGILPVHWDTIEAFTAFKVEI